MNDYSWIITEDCMHDASFDFSRDQAGTSNNGTKTVEEMLKKSIHSSTEDMKLFRLYDDDGNKYYEGVYVGEDEDMFAPLDDFGGPNAGCTEIRYLENGEWSAI